MIRERQHGWWLMRRATSLADDAFIQKGKMVMLLCADFRISKSCYLDCIES